ncbi:MAG: response regulator transcription factor [Chloroflexi bacterium]|jgi:two-component system KDP operon response regulator KdpE|nr:response regulator transcription factor [Chloroflexota bacterium]
MQEKILMIDDDTELLGLAQTWLQNAGYEPIIAEDGIEGLRQVYSDRPNLVLVDICMARMDGWEVCRRIREMCDMPIIIVSVNGEKADLLRGFNLGVDDYITKPFNFPELIARVQAVLRRVGADWQQDSNNTFHNEEIDIDWRSRQVWVRGQKVALSPTEFRLLSCLIENRGWIVTHEELLRKVWGPNYFGDRTYVKLYVRYLRQKIEREPSNPRWILTERGVGYRFSPSDVGGWPAA